MPELARKLGNKFCFFNFDPLTIACPQKTFLVNNEEKDFTGRQTHRNRTSQEDDLKVRQPYKKRTLQEDRKKALYEEDITGI